MLKIYVVINRLNFLQISFCALSLFNMHPCERNIFISVSEHLLYSHPAISSLDWTSPSPSAFLTFQYTSNFLVTLMALHWILSSFFLSHLNLGAKTERCVPVVTLDLLAVLFLMQPSFAVAAARVHFRHTLSFVKEFWHQGVLASSKQQTSQDSELGQQLVPQSPQKGVPACNVHCFSLLVLIYWAGPVDPVEFQWNLFVLAIYYQDFISVFQLIFFNFIFFFPDDGRAAVFIATGHESSGNLIPQVALLPVCVWVLLLIILFHLHCEASVLAHVVLLPASCCCFPAHLPRRSRTCWPLPAAPWADSSGVQPKPASHHSHLILHSPTRGCILVAHHLCKHLSLGAPAALVSLK